MRSLIPVACNQLATLLLGIISLKLISEYIPAALNGEFTLFVTLAQLGMLVTHSGLLNHGMRYWQRESERSGSYARFLWTMTWRRTVLLVPLLLVVCGGVAWWQRDAIWFALFPVLIFSNVAVALFETGAGALNAERKQWSLLLLRFAGTAARVIAPVAVGLAASMTLMALSTGYAIHGLIIIGILGVLFRRTIGASGAPVEIRKKWNQELKDYGRPFIFMGIGGWLLQSADRWIVISFFGAEQAGLFAYAAGMGAMIAALAAGGLMQLVFPVIFRGADLAKTAGDWRELARKSDQATWVFLGITLAGLVGLSWVAPWLVGPLIGREYEGSLAMLLPAGLAMAGVQVNQFHYLLLQGQHNSAGMVRIMLTVALIKTIGSIAAAAISWSTFLGWLVISLPLGALLGRWLIRRTALRPVTPPSTSVSSLYG